MLRMIVNGKNSVSMCIQFFFVKYMIFWCELHVLFIYSYEVQVKLSELRDDSQVGSSEI